MHFSFRKEILFKEWLYIREQKGMPEIPFTCSVGLWNGPLLQEVDYKKNTFDPYTRLYNYEFDIKDGVLRESFFISEMKLHFVSEISTEQEEIFLHQIEHLFELSYIGRMELETSPITFLKQISRELNIECVPDGHEVHFHHELSTVRAEVLDDGAIYFENISDNELLKLIKKIRSLRLQSVFK